MNEITIKLTIEEINDILYHIEPCLEEGYIKKEDPARSAIQKLNDAIAGK
jgi:hypothetical protein